ncbi:MAG: SDR family NAD(P)-dependent oxidoreductase [Pseudomonadota bacterium]
MQTTRSEETHDTASLQGHVILITGAGDGIGRAVALACAGQGATVVLLGKTVAKLEAVYDQIVASGAPEPAIYPMHLQGASAADYVQLANTLDNHFGCLHGLVNNAASLPYLSRLKDYEADDWLQTIQVNLNAPFLLTQACLPLLQAAPAASIIFTGDSALAEQPAFGGAYAITKRSTQHLMTLWAHELECTRIRVNLIDPGPTRTRLRKTIFPGEASTVQATPEQVASSYVWLLGSQSLSVHGQMVQPPQKPHSPHAATAA